MTSNDPTPRDWRAHPPMQSRYAREWRSHGSRDSRWSRKTKLRALAAILFALAATILYLFAPVTQTTPAVHILALGIGRYEHPGMPINPGGPQDARAFEQLKEKFPRQFPVVTIADDALSGAGLLRRLSEDAQAAPLAGKHWIVFVTLHAAATAGGGIELYAIEATPDSPSTPSAAMVPLSKVIELLRGSTARRTLLVLDGSRLGSHWRMGLLANDVAAQLIQELGTPISFTEPTEATDAVKVASPERGLTVLYAAGPGQRSWTTSQGSLLVEQLIAGLSGKADGWLDLAGKRKFDASAQDLGITLRELAIFLQEQLRTAAREQTGEEQTVLWLGDSQDFTVAAVTTEVQKAVSSAADIIADAQPTAATSDDKTKTAAKDSGDGKSAKSETKPSTTDAATPESTKPVTTTPEPGTKSESAKPSPVPAPTMPVKDRLAELWKLRDDLRSWPSPSRKPIAQRAPFSFKAFEAHLAVAEIRQDSGWEEAARDALREAEKFKARLPSSEFGLSDLSASTQTALRELIASDVSAESLAQAQQFLQSLMVEPAPNSPPAVPAKEPSATVIAQWLLQDLKADPSAKNLAKLQKIMERLEKLDRVPQTAEMALIHDLVQAGKDEVGDFTPELIGRWMLLRSRLLRVVQQTPTAVPAIRGSLEQALRALDAAEAWFLHLGAKSSEGRDWLDKAEAATQQAEQLAQSQAKALSLCGDLLLELAPLAEWIAARSMDDPSRNVDWSQMRKLAERWREMTQQRQWDTALLSRQWPEKPAAYASLERNLLTACAGTQQLKSALAVNAMAASGSADALNVVTLEVNRQRQVLLQQVRGIIPRSLGEDAPSLTLWREADRLRFQTWLSGDERQHVTAIRRRTPRGAPFAGGSVDQVALWHGFWAVVSLSVLEAPADSLAKLWQRWDDLAVAVQREQSDPAQVRVRRIELGAAIRQTWRALQDSQAIPVDVPWAAALTAARLDATVQPLITPDQQWQAAERRGFADGLLLFAEDWQRRSERSTLRSSVLASRLAQQSRVVARELGSEAVISAASGVPRIAEVSRVAFDPDRRGRCEISFAGDVGVSPLQLLVQSPAARVIEPQQEVSVTRPLRRTVPADGKLTLDLRLDEAVQSPQRLSLVLATPDGFPLEFRRVPLLPPFDPGQWRIQFLDAATGQALETEALFGHRGAKVFLNPSGISQLKAELVRPATDQRRAAKLTVFRLTADGRAPVLQDVALTLEPGRERTPLPLGIGGGEKDPKPTDAAVPALSIDLSRGWMFEITPENEPAFEFHLRPVFWSAAKFVAPPQPALTDNRFQVTVERRMASLSNPQDKLLPPQVAVQLRLTDALQGLATNRVMGSAEPTLTLGQQTRLGFLLPDDWRDRITPQGWDVMLDVAGLPHAYRWRITPNGTVATLSGQPPWLAVQVDNGRSLPILVWGKDAKSQESLKLRMQLDATELDRSDETADWRLAYQVVRQQDTGASPTPLEGSWRVPSSLNHQVRLESLQAGVWKFATSASDYLDEKKIDGLTGRFELQARLLRGGEKQAEQRLVFAIDDDSPAKLQIEGLDKNSYQTDQPISFKLIATDAEAGIVRLAYGFDKNGDKQLQVEEEKIDVKTLDWFENPQATWNITVPRGRLPVFEKKEELARLIVVAENGLGKETTLSRTVPLIKSATDKSSTGSLIINFERDGNKGKALVELMGPESHSTNPSGGSQRFDSLPPGNYTVNVVVNYNVVGVIKEGKGAVTVKAGEVAKIDVSLTTAKRK